MTGFYMKFNTGLKWANKNDIITEDVFRTLLNK